MSAEHQKNLGQYFTPDQVVESLVAWAVQDDSDQMLDPSCGDGRFLALHANSVGIEQDPKAYREAKSRAPHASIHESDFFEWAAGTDERFDCAAGNPPFIRYQRFKGAIRERAQRLCADVGAKFSGLSSSWAPFLVVAASLLRRGGRIAFVVPAEIGHAPYAQPLMAYLLDNFSFVHVIAIRKKLFPHLSEDAWLLFASGKGDSTNSITFSAEERFEPGPRPPAGGQSIERSVFARNHGRLRRFLVGIDTLELYEEASTQDRVVRFGDIARIGIGYVTGANSFFHLRPSEAEKAQIPSEFLRPTVRSGRFLNGCDITEETVAQWQEGDLPMLLLDLPRERELPSVITAYLESDTGIEARQAYKCRVRDPWYSVPDVNVPDAFLSYMSGGSPSLVANRASCVCTNSVHAVRLTEEVGITTLKSAWTNSITTLSCELEGHPLGGGMLKLEPREASRILLDLSSTTADPTAHEVFADAVEKMKIWRHSGETA